MKRVLPSLGLAALTLCVLLAQQEAPLVFDVASVKPNRTGDSHTHIGHNGGALTMTNVNLRYCIMRAYGVADAQVSGPAWLDTERYDIVAKAADDAGNNQYPLRLRALLAERFKLTLHRETQETAVYALVVAKNGPRIKQDESAKPGDGDIDSSPGHVTAKGVSMAHLAEFLAGPRAALGHVVIDKTGLAGNYTFDMNWTPDGSPGAADSGRGPQKGNDAPPPIFAALQEQLGLKLEARKAPVEVLVIDHAEKIPTEN